METSEQHGKFSLKMLPDPTIRGEIVPPTSDVALAKTYIYNLHFARDKANTLYVYKDGVYSPVGRDLHAATISITSRYKQQLKWSTRLDNSVHDYLTKVASTQDLPERPNANIVNLQNGMWFIDEEKFEPHDERYEHWKYLSTTQLPVDYIPDATCEDVTQFLEQILPGGSDLLYDVLGICATSDTSQHKAVVLLGDGSNGKSMFLYGLRNLIGEVNCSSTGIHMLCDPNNRFANNDLIGKLVNASDDTAQGDILDTANIKSIISGNPIRVEGKFKTAITYRPYCKMIFGANHRLSSKDETSGYLRRIMHIPFTQRFTQSSTKDKELKEMFNDPKQLSGMLNIIFPRLKSVISDGFTIPDSLRSLVETYDPIPEVIDLYLKRCFTLDPNYKITCHDMRLLIQGESGAESFTHEEAARYVCAIYPDVKIAKPRGEDGKQVRCFIGIRVSDTTEQEWQSYIQPPGTVVYDEPPPN